MASPSVDLSEVVAIRFHDENFGREILKNSYYLWNNTGQIIGLLKSGREKILTDTYSRKNFSVAEFENLELRLQQNIPTDTLIDKDSLDLKLIVPGKKEYKMTRDEFIRTNRYVNNSICPEHVFVTFIHRDRIFRIFMNRIDYHFLIAGRH